MGRCRVLVIGSANMDLIIQADHIPAPGETVLGGRFQTARGGKGANQAVACARLGAETWFLGRVGSDAFGDELAAGLVADGVDCSWLRRDDEPTGVAMIVVDARGENSIVVAPGANSRVSCEDLDAVADWSFFDAVLFQLEVPLETIAEAARRAREAGCLTVLDAGPPALLPEDMYPYLSVISPNETETRMLLGLAPEGEVDLGSACQEFIALGAGAVVLKLGAEGALVATSGGQRYEVPAFKVRPIDTTGAGDAFTAALAVALAEGMSLEEATRFACAAGALATTKMGAAPSMPKRAEVEEFLAGQEE